MPIENGRLINLSQERVQPDEYLRSVVIKWANKALKEGRTKEG